jgi:hypothetical protein
MEEIDSQTTIKPPDHLYHYTSIEGVKGILEKRLLQASEIHFLNDTQEFKYSANILNEIVSTLREKFPPDREVAYYPSPPSLYTKSFIQIFIPFVEQVLFIPPDEAPICIFSLSENGDLLSQWRGYCPFSGGY